jgi:signal transduction histidine kinase
MTIRARFTLLLGLLLAGLLAALIGLKHLVQARRADALLADRQARAQHLNHWIETAHRELVHFATEIAQSDELAAALARRDSPAARRLLQGRITGDTLAALWVARGDGAIVLHAAAEPGVTNATPPLTPGELARLLAETPSPRFFAEADGQLLEICARPLRPGGERHWLLLARRWDESLARALSALTESTVTLRPAHELARPPEAESNLVLLRPLADSAGRPLRTLRLDHALAEAERALETDWRQTLMFIVFGLLVLLAVTLALQAWVLRPLTVIGEGLASPTGAPAAALTAERGEFGRVAQLVVSASAQRAALAREVEERARAQAALSHSENALREKIAERTRLGRDLHDGVIQSLYAAGMGLASIRTQLWPEQAEAAARIEQASSTLNASIRDLRNFIDGLEPEALRQQSFAQAMGDLLEAMGGMKAFQPTLDLDDRIAARLTLPQRVHALQIIREAVSNALRHGRANRIEIALRARGGLAELKITDNGCGFSATSLPSHGKGLANLSQRARELGAALTVESHPGRGTIVTLALPLP